MIAARASFPDVESACRASTAIVGSGLLVTRVELMDGPTILAVNARKGTDYSAELTILLELAGSEASVPGDVEAAREIRSPRAARRSCSSATPRRGRACGRRATTSPPRCSRAARAAA